MCRITAVISERPAASVDLLCGGPLSLLSQAGAVEGRFQDDGWGIGYYRGAAPAVKSTILSNSLILGRRQSS